MVNSLLSKRKESLSSYIRRVNSIVYFIFFNWFLSRPRILSFFSALRSRTIYSRGKTAFARTRNDDARIAEPTMRILIYTRWPSIPSHANITVDAKTWEFLKILNIPIQRRNYCADQWTMFFSQVDAILVNFYALFQRYTSNIFLIRFYLIKNIYFYLTIYIYISRTSKK